MEVTPFRGIRYNQKLVGDLAQVICPPYDVISPEQQRRYYEQSDYNAIRLEYPLTCQRTGDSSQQSPYYTAAATFHKWLEQGVLQFDDSRVFYLHNHYFKHAGEEKVRRGLIARVRLEPWGNGIFPHEETLPKAKNDRLKLLQACHANFSLLLSLYRDEEGKVVPMLDEAAKARPLIETSIFSPLTEEGMGEGNNAEKHIIWAITDPEISRHISQSLLLQSLHMADGHHRYETALAYQLERAQRIASDPSSLRGTPATKQSLNVIDNRQKEAFNYVMMELVEFSDPGLVVLPIQRLVRGIAPSRLAGLEKQLENFFTLEYVPLTEVLPTHRESQASSVIASEAKQSQGLQGMVLGILGLRTESLVVLKKRQNVSFEGIMLEGRSQAYNEYNVSILNHVILDKLLGVTSNGENIAYTTNITEAWQKVREGEYQLAFLVNPPQSEVVRAFADARDKMPAKSTYFYPKLPAGLVINSLD